MKNIIDKKKILKEIEYYNKIIKRGKIINRLLGNKKYSIKLPGGGQMIVDDTNHSN